MISDPFLGYRGLFYPPSVHVQRTPGCHAIVGHAAYWQHATGSARAQLASFLLTNLTKATMDKLRAGLSQGSLRRPTYCFLDN